MVGSQQVLTAAVASILYAAVIIVLLAFHLVDTPWHWMRDPVSNYGVGRTANLFQAYTAVSALAGVALAAAFYLSGPAPSRLIVYLILAALARVGVALFPTDPGHELSSRRGRIHMAFAVATFALTYMALDVAADVFLMQGGESWIAQTFIFLRWAAMLSLVAVVLSLAAPFRRVFGLAERAFLLSTAVFMLLAAFQLLSLQN